MQPMLHAIRTHRFTVALVCSCILSAACGSRDPIDLVENSDTDLETNTIPVPVIPDDLSLPRVLDFTPFSSELDALDSPFYAKLSAATKDGGIVQLRTSLDRGDITSAELTLYYLSRIRAYNGRFKSVIELNPDALVDAARFDAMSESDQSKGRLHGIPILLKDNIAAASRMHNTAGSAALSEHVPSRDAFTVQLLRNEGAVILGKTNLSEWSNLISSTAPAGHSTLGGQVVNPFSARLDVSGSSSGSAVAATVQFAAATLGTETVGGIIAPAAANGVAGMRPTLGLVSNVLIIPVTSALDVAGPISRRVSDLAEMLTVLGIQDDNDPNSILASGSHSLDFTANLKSTSLNGLRIGMPQGITGGSHAAAITTYWAALDILRDNGAIIVPVPISGIGMAIVGNNQEALQTGSMRDDLANYFTKSKSKIHSLDEVIRFNEFDLARFAPHGQDLLIKARCRNES